VALVLLQISWKIQRLNNCENRPTSVKIMNECSLECHSFLTHCVCRGPMFSNKAEDVLLGPWGRGNKNPIGIPYYSKITKSKNMLLHLTVPVAAASTSVQTLLLGHPMYVEARRPSSLLPSF